MRLPELEFPLGRTVRRLLEDLYRVGLYGHRDGHRDFGELHCHLVLVGVYLDDARLLALERAGDELDNVAF